jgi:hypothetical protein
MPWEAGYVPDCVPIYVSEASTSILLVYEDSGCLFQRFATTPRGIFSFLTVDDTSPCIDDLFPANFAIAPSHDSSA